VKETPRFEGAGQGEGNEHPSPIAPLDRHQACIDPRAAILLRAAARYDLLRSGEIELDQAFDPAFVDDILAATGACPCRDAMDRHFDRIRFEDRAARLRQWRRWRRR
jgi:hypothetical protein